MEQRAVHTHPGRDRYGKSLLKLPPSITSDVGQSTFVCVVNMFILLNKSFYRCRGTGLPLIYRITSANRPTMGPTLHGPFREVVGLGS